MKRPSLLLALVLVAGVCLGDQFHTMDSVVEDSSRVVTWQAVPTSRADEMTVKTYRARVPGGWLVFCSNDKVGGATYIPDVAHEWLR